MVLLSCSVRGTLQLLMDDNQSVGESNWEQKAKRREQWVITRDPRGYKKGPRGGGYRTIQGGGGDIDRKMIRNDQQVTKRVLFE